MKNQLSRRNFLSSTLAGAAAFSLGMAGKIWADGSTSAHPNVLFIAIDDLWDWVGYMGNYAGIKTPNLDRLALCGLAFNNAHIAGPICEPSRTAILTGKNPWSTGVYELLQEWPDWLLKRETLTQAFMNTDYYVAGVGKIYHGGNNPAKNWHLCRTMQDDNSEPAPTERRPGVLGNPLDCDDSETQDGKRAIWAINRLKEKYYRPLFLACGFVKPHLNWNVPRKYFDMYPLDSIALPKVLENDLDDLPDLGRKIALYDIGRKKNKDGSFGPPFHDANYNQKKIVENGNWRKNVQAGLASITFVDAQVGKLLDAWDASAYSKNGIIVLWSDHGQHLGEKEHWRKMTLWEESTHAPFIVVAPGITKPGVVCTRPVGLIDIFPTLIELCSLNKRSDLDGQSLVPLLRNPQAAWDKPAITAYCRNNYSVRSERWRYIQYRDGSEELYDHKNDPHEWHNLIGKPEYKDIIEQHRKHIPKQSAENAEFSRNHKSAMEDLDLND